MVETEEHLVGLKVMRLTRPALTSPLPVTCDTKDLPGNLLNIALQQDPTAVPGLETIAVGQFLLLPQSPVNIYLGETFSSYICVFNETDRTVNNVVVKVDLQTSSQRLSLPVNPATAELGPDETVNNVIHHEVKELGTHILICEVTYLSSAGTPASFRKFFKLQVLKPLDIKTKFYNAESDEVYVEAQVQNITSGPICLERVSLEASQLFTVTSLNNIPGKDESVFGATNLLQPQASSQFLYCLAPHENLYADLRLLSGATNIGKLDIVWRSNLGERGRLQTSQLQRMGPEYGDIRLSIIDLPNFIVLEEKFSFKCKLVNTSERTSELRLDLDSTPSITWCDVSGKRLPQLQPGKSQEFTLCAVPLMVGLQAISGIRLTDINLKRTYTFDDIAQVFVLINMKNLNRPSLSEEEEDEVEFEV